MTRRRWSCSSLLRSMGDGAARALGLRAGRIFVACWLGLMMMAMPGMAEGPGVPEGTQDRAVIGMVSWTACTRAMFAGEVPLTDAEIARLLDVTDGTSDYLLMLPEGAGDREMYLGAAVRFVLRAEDAVEGARADGFSGVYAPQGLEIVGATFRGDLTRMGGDTVHIVGDGGARTYFAKSPMASIGEMDFTLTDATVVPQGRDSLGAGRYRVAYDPETNALLLVVAWEG